jgi:methylase of polypeptide subunit release factors
VLRMLTGMRHVRDPSCGTSLPQLISFLKEEKYGFVTTTPATHTRVNQRVGNGQARSLIDAFGWSRPFPRSLLPSSLFELLKDSAVISESPAGWKSSVRASTLEGELFLHSEFPTVSLDAVFFGPDTYRFASAIKQTLSAGPRHLPRALDLGCGSGAGGVILAKNAKCQEVIFTDINDRALQMTRLNARAAGILNINTVNSDLFKCVDGNFDIIVANPPYLNDPLKRAYRHGGGEMGSGLSLSIARAAKDRLSPGGTLLLYTGSPIIDGVDHLLEAVQEEFATSGLRWSYREIDPDVFGEELETAAYGTVDRIAAVLLTAQNTE